MNKKSKVFIIISLFVILHTSVVAQTYIKTNALYWLGLLPNVQVETKLGRQFTFQGEVNASFWKPIKQKPYIGSQFIVGSRWYPKQAFQGFYVGGDFSFDMYKVSKWNYPIGADGSILIQQGIGYYLGVTLGYQLSIAKRWNMDFYAGGGWHLGQYWGERVYPNGESFVYVPWNKSGEWIPYKLGVAFSYRLNSDK